MPGDGAVSGSAWKQPIFLLKPAGAVIMGSRQFFRLAGVRPDGTSTKVFFTGSGMPLFVAPSSTGAGPDAQTSSESGEGRLASGIVSAAEDWDRCAS
mmetsp:Transcript_44109/g.118984  ORF Transcript_44109/g.118984 Transcript_44109/m.118984 type:complete len:97 (+) Transcript_44109:551-841(+)